MSGHLGPHRDLPLETGTDTATPTPLHLRPSSIAAVAAGGFVGALARYRLGVAFPETAGQWPVTTFAINVSGAFLLGLLLEALIRLGPDSGRRQRFRLAVGTGVLGSFTTYSTLAVDTDLLVRGHHWWVAVSYAGASVLAGLVASAVGIAVGARVASRQAGTA